MAISPDTMRLALEELRKRDRTYRKPSHFSMHLPEELNIKDPANQEEYRSVLEPISERGKSKTRLQGEILTNRVQKQALRQAKGDRRLAAKLLRQAKRGEPTLQKPGKGPLIDVYAKWGKGAPGKFSAKQWGKDRIPEVSDIGKLRPHGPLVSITSQGHTTQVNRQVAPIFVAFLRDLTRSGYKIHSLGGHNDRNIAGTNTPSLHSYGFAIDINPAQNPVSYGKMKENLPPGIGRLAAKYGLSWGGQWNSYKDPMHFSVPYGGRE